MNSNKGFIYSLIAHIAFLLVMALQVVFYPTDALDLSRAIRVDMVALPDKIDTYQIPEDTPEPVVDLKEPEKKSEPEPVVKPEPEVAKPLPLTLPEPKPEIKKLEPATKPKVTDDSININKVKSKQKEALNKLKTSAAIDKLKKELSEPKSEPKPKQVFKGRILSAGTSLTGLDKLQSDSYLSQLDARIKSHWTLPQWLIGKPLRARVQIKLDENGNIIFKKITQSSGNSTYDDYCLATIDKATSLPKVPEKFVNVYKIDGITIGFPD